MGTFCPICGYENPQEEFETCPECGFDIKNGMDLYDKPLEGIQKASELLTKNKQISPEEAKTIYDEIVQDSGKVINTVKANFEQNIQEIMARFQMDAQYDPATAQEYIKPYTDIFTQASTTINQGLEVIGKALTSSTPENFQEIQMQLDLGTTLIEQGFFAMNNLDISLSVDDDGEYPIETEELSQMLEYVHAYLGSYLDTKNVQELKAALYYLSTAKEYLEEEINAFEGIQTKPSTDLKEELSYGEEPVEEVIEEYEEETEEPIENESEEEHKEHEEAEPIHQSVDSLDITTPPVSEENTENNNENAE